MSTSLPRGRSTEFRRIVIFIIFSSFVRRLREGVILKVVILLIDDKKNEVGLAAGIYRQLLV